MGQFDFVSPGAAAGDAIRNYMIQQEALRRQQLQDSLILDREKRLKEHDAAEIALQRAQLGSIDEQRKQGIADRQAAQAKTDAEGVLAPLRAGDTVGDDAYKTVAKVPGLAGYFDNAVTQGPQTGEDENGVPQYDVKQDHKFKGTPKEREALDIEHRVHKMLEDDPDLMKNPEIARLYKWAATTKEWGGFYSAIAQLAKPEKDTRSLAQQANDAMKAGDAAEYQRLIKVIKETGQADDRPFAPYVLATPGAAPIIIDRSAGTERAVVGPDGKPAPVVNTAETANRNAGVHRAEPVLAAIDELSTKINTQEGLLAKMAGGAEKQLAKVNYDDDVAEYMAVVDSFTPLLARALGHVGVLTQQDVDSAKAILPKPGDSKSLRDRKIKRVREIIAAAGAEASNGGDNNTSNTAGPPKRNPNESNEQYSARIYDYYQQASSK